MAKGDPYVPPNPWVWAANDRNGVELSISVPWNAQNRGVQSATVVRPSGCLLSRIFIGVGPDGTPDTSTNVYSVPVGTTSVAANILRQNGLNTIDDVIALQITAA